MSKAATISKLEALLSRIRTRAAEPHRPATPPVRAVAAAPAAPAAPARAPVPQPFVPAAPAPAPFVAPPAAPVAAAPVAAQPPPAPVAPSAPAPVAARPAPAPVAPVAAPPAASATPSVAGFTPPAARVAPVPESTPPLSADDPFAEGTLPPPAPASGDVEFDVDVDVSPSGPPEPMATPEVGHDPTASVERLSAAPIADPELVAAASSEAEEEDEDEGPSIQSVELLGEHEGIAGEEDDAIEEAPASSRRPVTTPPADRLADLAFGADEQPPRHTPPPKSGRLPAPPSAEFDPDVTGVRETSPSPIEPEPLPVQAAEPKKLVPEPARPNLASPAEARVVDVIGEAQSFDPATFLELLDASLSL